MTPEELADLIRANSASLTDVRGDLAAVRRNIDFVAVLSTMQRQLDALSAEVADLKRKAS